MNAKGADNAIDIEAHLIRARAMVRAIMMTADEITADPRDALMLAEITNAINVEIDAIDRMLSIETSGASAA